MSALPIVFGSLGGLLVVVLGVVGLYFMTITNEYSHSSATLMRMHEKVTNILEVRSSYDPNEPESTTNRKKREEDYKNQAGNKLEAAQKQIEDLKDGKEKQKLKNALVEFLTLYMGYDVVDKDKDQQDKKSRWKDLKIQEKLKNLQISLEKETVRTIGKSRTEKGPFEKEKKLWGKLFVDEKNDLEILLKSTEKLAGENTTPPVEDLRKFLEEEMNIVKGELEGQQEHPASAH